MEIDLLVAQSCIREMLPLPAEVPLGARLLIEFLNLTDSTATDLLTAADVGALALTCRALYNFIGFETDLLLRYEGYIIRGGWPAEFSPLALYAHMQNAKAAGDAHWERSLLSSAVAETRASSTLSPLVVHTEASTSDDFWLRFFLESLSLSAFPSAPHVATATERLNAVIALADPESGFPRPSLSLSGIIKTVASAASPKYAAASPAAASASSSAESDALPTPNKILALAVLIPHVQAQARALAAKNNPIDKAALAALLSDSEAVQYAVALAAGADVDSLRGKWTLGKAKLVSVLRSAIIMAVGDMNLSRQSATFKAQGFFKALFRSLHWSAEVPKRIKDGKKAGKAFLLHALLTESKYPGSAEAFEASSWAERVATPLAAWAKSPLFVVENEEEWTSTSFVPSLAGTKLKKPLKNSVECVLARMGCTHAAWDYLLETGCATPAQILKSLRVLILIGYPVDKIQTQLEEGTKGMGTMDLIKVKSFLEGTFSDAFVTRLTEQIAKVEGEPDAEGLVRVVMEPITVKDKKGQAKEIVITRRVSAAFAKDTHLVPYTDAVDALVHACIARDLPNGPVYDQAVIVNTPEMENLVRTGLPPAIPAYTRASLWRNEAVCLQQIAREGEELDHIIAGISWCESQTKPKRIDLDLSIMLYDASFTFLDKCSYQKKVIPGCTHSGDITSAPYPDGAREDVRIDFEALRAGFPSAKYVVIMVYSYAGMPYDDMEDASVFVANPFKPGTGPGGLDIVSAARLSGEGTVNISGYIDIQEDRKMFYCIDHSPNSSSRNAAGSTSFVANLMSTIVAANNDPNAFRSLHQSAFLASAIAKRVSIIHGDGVEDLPEGASLSEIMDALFTLSPTNKPVYNLKSDASSLIMFGGDLDDATAAAGANSAAQLAQTSAGLSVQDGKHIVFVNTRSPESSVTNKAIALTGGGSKVLYAFVAGCKDIPKIANALPALEEFVEDAADAGPSSSVICD